MKTFFLISALCGFSLASFATETIQLGQYSGQPGYFVRIGKGSQDVLNAIIMTPEAIAQLQKIEQKQKLKADINQTRTCEVEGLAQSIGYTIFAIKNCK